MANIQDFYDNHIKNKTASQLADEFYKLTGTSITGGYAKDMNDAVEGKDVRDDIVYLAMLIRAYNDLVVAAAEDVPADTSTRLSALETETATKFRYVGKSYTTPSSANDLVDNGVYVCSVTEDYPNGTITDLPYTATAGWLEVTRSGGAGSIVLQVFYPYFGTNDYCPHRRIRRLNNTWTDWIIYSGLFPTTYEAAEGGISADTLTSTGIYLSSTSTTYPNGKINDLPYSMGWLQVVKSGNLILQVFYPYYGGADHVPMRRYKNALGVWSDWTAFSENNSITYNVTQETRTINASPTISTGIPYVLTASGDNTDRTADIEAVLSANGACQLGTGVFYVKNLEIGKSQSLRGNGVGNTIVKMLSGDGCAIKITSASTADEQSSVSDLTVFGGIDAEADVPSSRGSRNGIEWIGSWASASSPGSYPLRGQISNVCIYGFNGAGIYCASTSDKVAAGTNTVNVNIYYCHTGIYIPINSEFHRFTNVSVDHCKIGAFNNGGNNCFVNCGFNANGTGFVIDNTSGDAVNTAHGSMVGCTINHSGDSVGTAIELKSFGAGYTFDGCQIWFGGLNMVNAKGVLFTGCQFGDIWGNAGHTTKIAIPVTADSSVAIFNGCVFRTSPNITNTNSVLHIDGCYIRDTGAVVTL